MKTVAFLPVKGSSDRVENKNIKLLDGKPLFLHTLEKLLSCEFIDEVYLDTESEEIISIAIDSGCNILRRDPSLANNKTDGNTLFYNEIKQVEADIYIQILGTSPFISPSTIKNGLEALKSNKNYDSAVLVKKDRQYTWNKKMPNYNINQIPNSIDLDETIIETMGLYIVRSSVARDLKRRIGNAPYLIEATPLDAVDVNWPEEFSLANLIAAGIREKDRKLLDNLKGRMSSCLLSDLLDDLGYPNQVISGFKSNLEHTRVLGRAKTLKLRKLNYGEDFKGIYDALKSYDTIIPGDFILVENEISEYAYFGELNANLAIRSGAVGAFIGGATRDEQQVMDMGFPVFSKGSNCQDVRKRATTESINRPINIGGVAIRPGDLVFADSEGTIIIPQSIESKIIELVIKRGHSENQILSDISNGMAIDAITEKYGFF